MLPGSIEKSSYQTTENNNLVELSQGTELMRHRNVLCTFEMVNLKCRDWSSSFKE